MTARELTTHKCRGQLPDGTPATIKVVTYKVSSARKVAARLLGCDDSAVLVLESKKGYL